MNKRNKFDLLAGNWRLLILKWLFKLLLSLLILLALVAGASVLFAKLNSPNFAALGQKKESLVIQNIAIVGKSEDTNGYQYDVVIRGNKIVQISPTPYSVTPSDTVIDGNGKYLSAGLVDMHVHVYDRSEMLLALAHGVTTVRNLHGMPHHLRLKEEIASGQLDGPELFTSSPILNQKSQYAYGDHHWFPESTQQARTWVKYFKEIGYDLIKVYDGLSIEMYRAIQAEAKLQKLAVTGHPAFGFSLQEFIEPGLQSIEHAEMLFQASLNYSKNPEDLPQLIDTIKQSGIPVDITLYNFHELAELAVHKEGFYNTLSVSYLNPMIKEMMQPSIDFAMSVKNAQSWMNKSNYMGVIARRLSEAEVPLLVGSDAGAGFTLMGDGLIRELMRMEQVGISSDVIYTSATVNGALALGAGERFGKIAEGFEADLVLTEQNPLDNFSTYLKPYGVVNNGKYFNKKDVLKLKEQAKLHMSRFELMGWYLIEQWHRILAR
ncbi:amidohydrolase family protein [Aliikangiella marina]|uniref:Amidohydrolase family protein n=1 Tax=Aliikangiella marina TaxID=1712262 RepID=A0A545T4P2_9GAMM|nr:amidohydrolase family protein [Aliikangiella marina]TQV72200.1 amidohydrolase family protein [Aliikangiella marina]